jgi:MFS family permease
MRFGARTVLVPGLVLIAAGLALVARAPVAGHYLTDVLPAMLLMGVGIGVAFPALASLAMSGATSNDAGLASGLVNTTTQVGAALGLAVLATLSATRSEHLAAAGQTAAAALTGGYRLAFLIAAVLVVAAIAVALTVLRPERRAAEEPEDECDCTEAA